MSELKLYSKAAMISKSTSTGRASRLIMGYMSSKNDEEMTGTYYSKIKDEFPEWSIDDIKILEIPKEDLFKFLGIEKEEA